MMEPLIVVTLVYVGILVVALVGSLLSICVYLWRLGNRLERLAGILRQIAQTTAPLQERLEPFAAGLSDAARKTSGAQKKLHVAVERLELKAGVRSVG